MRSGRPSDRIAIAAVCAGAVLLGSFMPGIKVHASETRLTSFASMLSDRGLEGTDPESAERLPEEKSTDKVTEKTTEKTSTAKTTASAKTTAGSSVESTDTKPAAETATETVSDEKSATGSRLEGFASLLSDRGLEGGKPEDAERLPEEADERLTGFAELADQVGGTRTVSGKTSDKRLLGFAGQVASTDAAFGDRKEDKVIVMNAPAGALEISGPTDTRTNTQDAAGPSRTALLLKEIEGMTDQEILERLLAEAAEMEGEEFSSEEQVVLGATKSVKNGSVSDGAEWLATHVKSGGWTEETWSELFPANHKEDGRKLIDIGDYKLTAYCPCEICTGKTDGITKSGKRAVQGRTIAVDPKLLTLGMEVVIDGHVFTAEDTGSAIKGSHIDIYMDSHEQALAFGTRQAEVYLLWEPRGTTESAASTKKQATTGSGRSTASTDRNR